MRTELYFIKAPWSGRLAIVPRPRGGDWLEEDVRAWRRAGIDMVVSLLTEEESDEFELAQESQLSQAAGMKFVSFPTPDRGVPDSSALFFALVRALEHDLAEGKTVTVHCRQGIGRSALVAASLLVLTGLETDAAFERVSAARGCPVPETEEQRHFVLAFARQPAASRA